MDGVFYLTGFDPQLLEPAFKDLCLPVVFTLKIQGEEDMAIRLVKSKKACIEIPELDMRILPGKHSKDIICDVYGLLTSIEGSLGCDSAERGSENELIQKLEQIKKGELNATLLLTDPSGLSFIMGDASKEILNT